MSDIHFRCLECNQSIEAPPDMGGQLISCPSCNHAIKVPAPYLKQPPVADMRDQEFYVAHQPASIAPTDASIPAKYGGIGRIGYFLFVIAISILGSIIGSAGQGFLYVGFLVTLILSLVTVISRLHNIGKSGWWSLLIFVPFANLVIGAQCLAYPEGYAVNGKLDTPGKIVLALFALVVIAFVLAVFLS